MKLPINMSMYSTAEQENLMSQHLHKDIENISEAVKNELSRVFRESASLRAYYLICRRNEYFWPPFSSEDLAQFVIWLLINNFEGLNEVPAIPEIVIKYLIGDVKGAANAIAAAAKASFFDDQFGSSRVSWEEFYYLDFLPSRNLFHLTSSREKLNAATLCAERLLKQPRPGHGTKNESNKYEEPAIVTNFKYEESIAAFTSMKRLSSNSSCPFSITICGFHRSMTGLGEDARHLFEMLTDLGFRVELFNCSSSVLERDTTSDFYEIFETKVPSAEVVIFCMPIYEMARIFPKFSQNFFSQRYVVGYWPWELSAFPIGWREIMDLVDEVWASTQFLMRVYSDSCSKPVYHVPLCVEISDDLSTELACELIEPETISFISVFDFYSSMSRKNPIGSIRAFKAAFAGGEQNTRLVIKSLHGNINPDQLQIVLDEIGGDPRIILFDGPTTKASLNGLIANSSALLSLHRSEGFGRLPVEAMLLRTPVIATDWSGSCDYINKKTAFPIACNLQKVRPSEYPYAAGVWANPDLNDAARIMKQLSENKIMAENIVDNALSFARSKFSRIAVKDVLARRMKSIGEKLMSRRVK